MEDPELEDCSCEDCISQKPSEPLPSDCCGSGCEPCVNDLYDNDLKAWRKACIERHQGNQTNEDLHTVIDTGSYNPFKIEQIKTESADTYCYRFTIPNNGSLNLVVGQHLVLHAQVNGRWITRQYTPVSSLKAKGYFDMLIKLYKDGPMSSCISRWTIGDMVEWRGPYGRYQYQQNQYSHIVMLAAGTGIAPMLQVIRHIVNNDEEDTFVRLLYASKTYKDILLQQQLNQLTDFWNFTVHYVLSQEEEADCPSKYGEHLHFGRIDESLLAQEMPPNNDKSQILICGTKSFDKDMIKYLRKLNFEGDIFKF